MRTWPLGFQERFADRIVIGAKRQTVRAERRDCRRPGLGDRLTFYTGLRSKDCKKLGEGIVVDCFPVSMDLRCGTLTLNGVDADWAEREKFARADGFWGWADMKDWFRGPRNIDNTFNGWCVKWRPPRATVVRDEQ